MDETGEDFRRSIIASAREIHLELVIYGSASLAVGGSESRDRGEGA